MTAAGGPRSVCRKNRKSGSVRLCADDSNADFSFLRNILILAERYVIINRIIIVTTGNECGQSETDRVFWSLSSTGTLTISGNGKMTDRDDDEGKLPQWHADRNSIKEVLRKTA